MHLETQTYGDVHTGALHARILVKQKVRYDIII